MQAEFFEVNERHFRQVNGGKPEIWGKKIFIRRSAVVAYSPVPQDQPHAEEFNAHTTIHLVSQKAVFCSETPEELHALLA